MRTNISSILSGVALSALLVCFASGGALSQEQLPESVVNQQVPLAFAQDEGAPVADAAPAPVAAAETTATPAPASTETVETEAAQTPPADQIPEQPEQRKLVPATAMGAAAQDAAAGAGGGNPPVEDVTQPATASVQEESRSSSGLPDVLERYTSSAAEAQQEPAVEDGAADYGDALPAVNGLTMVKIEGDFDNSNKKVAVPVGQEASSARLQEEIRTEAFDAAITGMFPLSPEQIGSLLKKYDSTQKVVNEPPYDAPRPEISVQNISLDPGVAPPVVKTAVGNVTTINMLDATGAPWPVQDVTWAGDFEIVEPEEGGHIVRITPMGQFARGNIVIRLLTLKTPLTMTLETSRDVVQYRIDARIPEYGPFASAPLMQGAKSTLVAGSTDLTSLLDGVMPGGMQRLDVSGVDGRTTAYTLNGTTYLRTPLTLLSPAWQSSVSSADGMNVYALSNAPVVLLSDGGEFQRAVLKEKEGLLDE